MRFILRLKRVGFLAFFCKIYQGFKVSIQACYTLVGRHNPVDNFIELGVCFSTSKAARLIVLTDTGLSPCIR